MILDMKKVPKKQRKGEKEKLYIISTNYNNITEKKKKGTHSLHTENKTQMMHAIVTS